jgi:hypothetical protein
MTPEAAAFEIISSALQAATQVFIQKGQSDNPQLEPTY